MHSTVSIRAASIPRFALRCNEAAASLGISPSLFKVWIKAGRMPQGRPVDGVVLWDVEEIRIAWQTLSEPVTDADDGENPFDNVVV